MQRRKWLGLASGALMSMSVAGQNSAALPPARLVFPRDGGSHNDFRTEWWYVTGYAKAQGTGATYGFQITFFRSRIESSQSLQSGLAAKHLIFAHAALTDVQGKRLLHDQRIARWSGSPPGTNPADSCSASELDTAIVLRDWSLLRDGKDLVTRLTARDFSLDLRFIARQPVLLQGQQGLSRKGPDPSQASYYYSQPQLSATGTIGFSGTRLNLDHTSTAWLDHEWSQTLLHPSAVGWDWIGINLFDGSALTAFRLRDKNGGALWDGGSFRSAGQLYTFSRGEVVFKPLRSWRSALSKAEYPVEWMVRTPADYYTVKAVIDNQELDSSRSTGAIYWEGLCEVWDSNNKLVGRGYLEMTGYAKPLIL